MVRVTIIKCHLSTKFELGIHLRDGLRSYHANGYRVRLNYPEITIKSLARTVLSLPGQAREKVL